MTTIDSAVVLAAGLGLRMRPLTENRPKPLLRLGGETLLDHVLNRLAAVGVARVVVNAHWQAEMLAAHVEHRPPPPAVRVRHEPVLLDTGGAAAAALREGHVGPGAFFVCNSDSIWLDGPRPALRHLITALDEAALAVILLHRTFLVQGDVGFGDFFVSRAGVPRRRGEREIAPYIYAGVTLARAALFDGLADGAFSMNLAWNRALAAGRLRAVVHDGLWFHLSRPDDLAEAAQALAAQLTGATT